MTAALVDSNVLIDIATDDPEWAGWSAEALERIGSTMALVINPIIWSEVSVAFDSVEDLNARPAGDRLPARASALVRRCPRRASVPRVPPAGRTANYVAA